MVDENILQEIHDDWKSKGFPYYPKDEVWRNYIYQQLISFKRDTLVDRRNKIIGQSAHGLNLAWSFMEHAWGIKCGKMRTPIEIWNDEESQLNRRLSIYSIIPIYFTLLIYYYIQFLHSLQSIFIILYSETNRY